MAWNYDPASGQPKDKVRLLIGDTDTNDQQLQDAEIQIFVDDNPDNVYAAAQQACQALASKFARLANTTIESVSVTYGDLSQHYRDLAGDLQVQSNSGTNKKYRAVLTGTSISRARAIAANRDRIPNLFSVNQDTNPPGYVNPNPLVKP